MWPWFRHGNADWRKSIVDAWSVQAEQQRELSGQARQTWGHVTLRRRRVGGSLYLAAWIGDRPSRIGSRCGGLARCRFPGLGRNAVEETLLS